MSLCRIRSIWFLILLAVLTGCAINTSPQVQSPAVTQTPVIFSPKDPAKASENRLADPRPNIIMIMTDDQPAFTVANMPTVSSILMKDGVTFTNGFVTTPLCCPSRTSILTGLYSHNTGVRTNKAPDGGATVFDDTNTISVLMQKAGYKTSYVGKYLNEYEILTPKGVVPPGWDEWSAFVGKQADYLYYFNYKLSENGRIVEYPKKKFTYSADVVTQKAVDYINTQRNNPFMMMIGYYNPHSPYIAAPRHKDTYRADSGWDFQPHRPPNFNEEDISDKPAYLQQFHAYTPEELDITHRQILRSLLSVDEGVASILDTLKITGLADNTVIIYLSDNGETIGEHRFGIDKNCAYEECIKVPFIVYAPGKFNPRVDSKIVANIDIFPTILDLAGVTVPQNINGKSMVPLLYDPKVTIRNELLLEHWPTGVVDEEGIGSMIPEFHAIRTKEWKYVEYSTGETELYDLVNDPYELLNVVSDKKNAQLIEELKLRLHALMKE